MAHPASHTLAPRSQHAAKPVKTRAGLVLMTKRSDFVAAARAQKQGTKAMMVQGRKRDDDAVLRVGFTCSKKVGNAVTRNRAKRRLREVARLVLPEYGLEGWDYVLIGRATETIIRPFELLQKDLIYALRKIHSK